MTVSLGTSLASEGLFFYLLNCGRHSLVSGTQNDTVVSWITLWGMTKVYWLDFSLHFGSCCLLRVCHKFGPNVHLIISQLRTKHSSLNCPNHVWQTKSSIKKQVIVRRTVQSMFSQQTLRPVKNWLKGQWRVCWRKVKQMSLQWWSQNSDV